MLSIRRTAYNVQRKVPLLAGGRALAAVAASAAAGLKSIRLSPGESERRRLIPQNVQRVLEALHEDGMVMVENAIPELDEIDRVSDSNVATG